MSRLRFVLHALRCSVLSGEPLDVPEQEGLAEIIEDQLIIEMEGLEGDHG